MSFSSIGTNESVRYMRVSVLNRTIERPRGREYLFQIRELNRDGGEGGGGLFERGGLMAMED